MVPLAAFSAAICFVTASAVVVKPRAPEAWSEYTKNGVFYPQQSSTSWCTLYARTNQLPDNSLMLAWEDYDPNVDLAYIPIYKSTDGGASFNPLTCVEDQVNGWGLWYQPNFFTLPEDFGGFAKGMILLGAVSTPRNLSEAYIELYANGCPVHHKVSDSPLNFGEQEPLPIIPNDTNLNPNGSPYVIWTDATEDGSGLFITNGNSREEVFVNTDAVDPTGWKPVDIDHFSSYSRELSIIRTPADSAAEGNPRMFVANGGNIGCSGDCYNYVADALVDIPAYPA